MSDMPPALVELLARERGEGQERLLARLLDALDKETKSSAPYPLDREAAKGMLKERLGCLMKEYTFKQGDIVQWKKGLRNKKRPAEGEPAIVVEKLEKPTYSREDESGSSYFRERLDLILGLIDREGDLMLYHFDSRRFEPFEGDAGAPHPTLAGT